MRNLFLGLIFLQVPAPVFAAGATMPDVGQDLLLVLLMGFCAIFLIWLAHRLFPSWRNRLKANSKLGTLASFNTVAVATVVLAILICLVIQSFMILIIGFVAVPILGLTMLIEIAWGWSASKSSA